MALRMDFTATSSAFANLGQDFYRFKAKVMTTRQEEKTKEKKEYPYQKVKQEEPEKPAFNRYRALIDNDRQRP